MKNNFTSTQISGKAVFISFVISLCFSLAIYAQAPMSFKYQAVARDAGGLILQNKIISLKISILSNSPTGTLVYSETHNLATNNFGLVDMNIGKGTVLSGNFNQINWSNGSYFLKTEMDVSGGTNYVFMGTTQLLSVPYALYSERSGKSSNDEDTSSTNELQILSLKNDTLYLSKGNYVYMGRYIDNTDTQRLYLNGTNLSIGGGNSVKLNGVVDLDDDPTNELQNLSVKRNVLTISKGNSVVTDADTTNEIQQLIKKGNKIILTKADTISMDGDTLNEIQYLRLSNDTLYLTKANYVVLPPINNLKLNMTVTNVGCKSGANGSITLNVTGGTPPYTNYYWSTYNNPGLHWDTKDIDSLEAGRYFISVTDLKGFSAFKTVVVNEPDKLKLTSTITKASGYGNSDGSIDLNVAGGTPPFRYTWSNSAKTQDIYNLSEGYYTVTVKDTNNCTDSLKILVGCICTGTYTDSRDLQTYPVVQIGSQCWMKKNINFGTFSTSPTNNSVVEKYCYNNLLSNCSIYGGLYTWEEAELQGTNVCPSGWHLPNDIEWYLLENYTDTTVNDPNLTGGRGILLGSKLKSGGSTGFDILLSGRRFSGFFSNLNISGEYLSANIILDGGGNPCFDWGRYFENTNTVYRNQLYIHNSQSNAYSIRCIRNY